MRAARAAEQPWTSPMAMVRAGMAVGRDRGRSSFGGRSACERVPGGSRPEWQDEGGHREVGGVPDSVRTSPTGEREDAGAGRDRLGAFATRSDAGLSDAPGAGAEPAHDQQDDGADGG